MPSTTAVAMSLAACLTSLTLSAPAAHADPGEQVFSTPGPADFTVPEGVTKITVDLWGAGGGGGGFEERMTGGGGGSGSRTICEIPVTEGSVIPLVVGGGGGKGGSATPGSADGLPGAGPNGGAGGIAPTTSEPDRFTQGAPGAGVETYTDGSGGGGGSAGFLTRTNPATGPTGFQSGGGGGGGGGSTFGTGDNQAQAPGGSGGMGGANWTLNDDYPSSPGGHGDALGGDGGLVNDKSLSGRPGKGGVEGTCPDSTDEDDDTTDPGHDGGTGTNWLPGGQGGGDDGEAGAGGRGAHENGTAASGSNGRIEVSW